MQSSVMGCIVLVVEMEVGVQAAFCYYIMLVKCLEDLLTYFFGLVRWPW